MKKEGRKGISLIVLVITIIVIIILAAAVIITLNNNNPISEANKARFESDRDNMQSIFTNTVAKVMAQKQGSIKIKAGNLNSVTSGKSSVVGEAEYEIENSANSNSKSGKIIFDNKENEYYTGKRLPIYKSGATLWSVDNEGVINLSVGNTDINEEESGNNQNTNPGESGDISQEKYDNLLNEINQMKTTIQNQNTTIGALNTRLDKLENETILNKRELLFDAIVDVPLTTTWTNKNFGEITLSKSIEDYKYLEVNVELLNNDKNETYYPKSVFLTVSQIKYNNTNNYNWGNGTIIAIENDLSEVNNNMICVWFKTNNVINICSARSNTTNNSYYRIKSIYGIK